MDATSQTEAGTAPEKPGAGGVDAQSFRDALSRWASGVAVVAAHDAGGVVKAMTVTSFCSASLDPPLVVVALARSSRTLARLSESRAFTISVLSESQREVADACADVGDGPLSFDEDAAVEGALVDLRCSVEKLHECGDHVLVVGLVLRVRRGTDESPLLYWDRRYRAVQSGTPAGPSGA